MKTLGHFTTGSGTTYVLYRDEQGREYIEQANSLSTRLYPIVNRSASTVFAEAREAGHTVQEVPA